MCLFIKENLCKEKRTHNDDDNSGSKTPIEKTDVSVFANLKVMDKQENKNNKRIRTHENKHKKTNTFLRIILFLYAVFLYSVCRFGSSYPALCLNTLNS